MKCLLSAGLILFVFLSGCIKDDFLNDVVDPELTINSKVDSIALDTEHQFIARYLNNVGQEESISIEWSSSNPEIISIDEGGLAIGLASGSSVITAKLEEENVILRDSILVHVGTNTVITETKQTIKTKIETTTFYLLKGSLEITETDQDIVMEVGPDYEASSSLPGFYLYLSNNRNSISNALEVSKVTVFNGAHSYSVPNTSIGDYNYLVYYCKPFNIKVGEAVLN